MLPEDGVCGLPGGLRLHWKPHNMVFTGAPGAAATCKSGSNV